MTVHLVAPRRDRSYDTKKKFGDGFFRVPPLGLLNVAAITPRDIQIEILDENVEILDVNGKPDLVGISVMTASATRAYEIADAYRARGIPVVLGGAHVSLMVEEGLYVIQPIEIPRRLK